MIGKDSNSCTWTSVATNPSIFVLSSDDFEKLPFFSKQVV
jgi:hypothetical protein